MLAYKGVLWVPGAISQNWDQTFPAFASQIRAYGSISSTTWNALFEMGAPAPMNGLSFYFDQIARQGLSGLGGGLLARWLNLAYALAGAGGFWLLCRRLGLSGPAALVTCIISQFNPRTYALAVSGHTEGGFAYALAPWVIVLADGAIRAIMAAADGSASHLGSLSGIQAASQPGNRAANLRMFLAGSLAAGMVAALAFSSPFGITLAGSLLGLYGVAAMAAHKSLKPAWVLLIILAVTASLHLNWILPTVTGAGGARAFKHNLSVEDVQAEYVHKYREYSIPPRQAMIGHTDNLGMGTEYAYPVETPRDAWWKPSAYALLGLALLGLLCPVGNRSLKFFAAFSLLVGFWLLTGSKTLPGMFLYEVLLARVKVLFFFMARPTRWLLVYYSALALLAGLGVEAVRRRTFWTSHRWPDLLLAVLVPAVLGVYLWPWWSGQLTIPKNDTTQTMALTPQPLRPEEEQLVAAVNDDPGIYRVTVFPTISSPTGNIPAAPASSLTRNFGMLGKDSLVGPAFIGQPFGSFLLSLAHRQAVSTDAYGRLLGLGAVRRVLWDKQEPYLSYMDFGWMPQTKRGSETLSDPRGVLAPFLAVQRDLVPDPAWTFGPFVTLDNTDALQRVRAVGSASLAAGGYPLLVSLAQLEENIPASKALLFATDLDSREIESLGRTCRGLYVHNDAWPELLLPFLPEGSWHPAWQPRAAVPGGWRKAAERWHQALWLSGSPLDGRALWSQAKAELSIPLVSSYGGARGSGSPGASGSDLRTPGSGESGPLAGPYRVLLRAASLPGQHGLDIRLGGVPLAATQSASPYDAGWRWFDLGVLELGGDQALTVSARGRGAVVAGALAVPVAQFQAALAQLDASSPPEAGTTVLAEAEACVDTGLAGQESPPALAGQASAPISANQKSAVGRTAAGAGSMSGIGGMEGVPGGPYATVRDIALLAPSEALTMTTRDLKTTDLDGSGLGLLAAEGDTPGEAVFRVDFPKAVSGFSLVSYPRLFGDPDGVAYALAEWSTDGREYHPLYRLNGRTDGKWEHVYERREEVSVAVRATRLWLRFTLRQAQLPSLGNAPNQPMTLTVTPAEPFPGAPSQGQAVLLPAAFSPKSPRLGPHAVRARLLTPQGPRWQDMGVFEPNGQGVFHIALDRSGRLVRAGGEGGLADVPSSRAKAGTQGISSVRAGSAPAKSGAQGVDAKLVAASQAGEAPGALACDLFEIASLPQQPLEPPAPALETIRQSPARYTSQGRFPAGGLLVFSESFHPAWQASMGAGPLPQVKTFGSMNAYLLPGAPTDTLELAFQPEHSMDLGMAIVRNIWAALGVLVAGLLVWQLAAKTKKRQAAQR